VCIWYVRVVAVRVRSARRVRSSVLVFVSCLEFAIFVSFIFLSVFGI